MSVISPLRMQREVPAVFCWNIPNDDQTRFADPAPCGRAFAASRKSSTSLRSAQDDTKRADEMRSVQKLKKTTLPPLSRSPSPCTGEALGLSRLEKIE